MKNILVPTDFSKCANNALTYAFEIARHTGATVHLLHVVYPTEGVDNNIYNSIWMDGYLETRRRELDKVLARYRKNLVFKDVAVQSSVELGFPATTTDDYAEQVKADLIVMGTTGATGLRGAFLGSTAGAVISKTKRPVWVVPPKGAYHTTATIAMASDFKMSLGEASRAVLGEIVRLHHAKLKVVHILDKPGEKVDKSKEASMSHNLGDIPHDFHYIHDSDVPQAVNDYIEAIAADALVTVAHEHGLWHRLFYESVSKALVYRARVPMLVLHDVG